MCSAHILINVAIYTMEIAVNFMEMVTATNVKKMSLP